MKTSTELVAVVTASGTDNVKRGVTCSSFSHVSLRPPILSFSLNSPSRFHDLLVQAPAFAVHMLSKHQVVQSIHFSMAAVEGQCQFSTVPHEIGPGNVPILKDTTAVFLCEPHQHHIIGDHLVWYGKVTQVLQASSAADPLLYYSRAYRSIGDDSFMSAFEHRTLPFEDWTHQAHLRMAWNYISTFGVAKARHLIKEGIKRYNEANKERVLRGYHETLTEFYIHVVADAVLRSKRATHRQKNKDYQISFDQFIQSQTHLLNPKLVFNYYSEELLSSAKAKSEFLPPDRQPLPQIK